MERFGFILGVAIAAIFAIGALIGVGDGKFTFHVGDDEHFIGPVISGAEAAQPGVERTYPASAVILRDAVAVLRIVPEDRADVAVTITGGTKLPALKVGVAGDELVLDGELDRRIRDCRTMNGRLSVGVSNLGRVDQSAMPIITIRTPRDVLVATDGAVISEVGASRSAKLRFSGCGDALVGAVEQALALDVSGSGDVRASDAGSADIDSSGSADLTLGAIGGEMEAELSGSGSLTAGDVGGAARLRLAGSGDLQVGAVKGPLTAKLGGSGGIEVAEAGGDLELAVAGSGDLAVRGGQAGRVKAEIAGSGGISFAGTAESLEASIAGSGDVEVAKVTGKVQKSVAGSGEVLVGS